jgi:hypothetical protein
MFVRLKALRARQLADEVLRLVDQRRQALRADVRRAGFNRERQQWYLLDGSFAIDALGGIHEILL